MSTAFKPVPLQQRQQHVEIRRNLRDHRTVDLRQESGEQRRLAAPAAEQLDDADPLVAFDGRAQRIDRLDRTADGRRETDAIVGAEDVIIHRFRDGDDRKALSRKVRREA